MILSHQKRQEGTPSRRRKPIGFPQQFREDLWTVIVKYACSDSGVECWIRWLQLARWCFSILPFFPISSLCKSWRGGLSASRQGWAWDGPAKSPYFFAGLFLRRKTLQVVLPQPAAPISVLCPDERIAAQRFGYHACILKYSVLCSLKPIHT